MVDRVRIYALLQFLGLVLIYVVGTPRADLRPGGDADGFVFCRSLEEMRLEEMLPLAAVFAAAGLWALQGHCGGAIPLLPAAVLVASALLLLLQWDSLYYPGQLHAVVILAVAICNGYVLRIFVPAAAYTRVMTAYIAVYLAATGVYIYRETQAEPDQLPLLFSVLIALSAFATPVLLFLAA
jgi:hypothetical protein